MADEEETYESWTVAELREELTARNLHTSGNKEELVARLEEDDTAAEGGETPGQAESPPGNETPPADPWKMVYSPWELPSNTAAARAFTDANPEAVDPNLTLPDEQMALAQANIQDHVDAMAEIGITVEDPRLEGYTPPPPPELATPVEANA